MKESFWKTLLVGAFFGVCLNQAIGLYMDTQYYFGDPGLHKPPARKDADNTAYQLLGGDYNICLGRFAGYDLTNESYQFIFTVDGTYQYQTTMTPKEYKVVFAVVQRAMENKRFIWPDIK